MNSISIQFQFNSSCVKCHWISSYEWNLISTKLVWLSLAVCSNGEPPKINNDELHSTFWSLAIIKLLLEVWKFLEIICLTSWNWRKLEGNEKNLIGELKSQSIITKHVSNNWQHLSSYNFMEHYVIQIFGEKKGGGGDGGGRREFIIKFDTS